MYPRVIINVSTLPGMLGEVPGPTKNTRSGLERRGPPILRIWLSGIWERYGLDSIRSIVFSAVAVSRDAIGSYR